MFPGKSRFLLVVFFVILIGSFLIRPPVSPAGAGPAQSPTLHASAWNFLPIVRGQVQGPPAPTSTEPPPPPWLRLTLTPSATATPTQTPTNTLEPPTETPTSTATNEPPANTGAVRISKIFFDGVVSRVESDEYVEIENQDSKIVRLGGWKLHDSGQIHTYTFPNYNMEPGETCRVYTNENHPEWCGFNWGNGSAIWNNSGDEATLKDSSGTIIDSCSYDGGGDTEYCP